MQIFHSFFVLSCFYQFIFCFEKFSIWIWRLPLAVYMKLKLSIRYYEIPWEIGSRWFSECLVGLFWRTNLPPCWNCVPQKRAHNALWDNYLDSVSRATSKWGIGNYEIARESGTKFVPPNSSIIQFDSKVKAERLFTMAGALSLPSYSHSTQITRNK